MKSLTRFLVTALAAVCLSVPPAFADLILKQSTASQIVKLGPFVDSVDGNTEKTALTIANTDIKCSKNGGTLASKNSGGGTHDANGWYSATFDATDTNTVGRFQCFVHVTGALPVTLEANIVEEAVYDATYGASALGYVANAPVNVAQYGGTNGTFAAGRPEVNTSHIAGSAVSTSSAQIGVNVVNAGATAWNSGAITEASYSTTAGSVKALGILDQGTAQAATATTVQLRAAATFADDTILGATAMVCGSTQGYCQSAAITDYVSSTDTATVATWPVTPSGTITYYVFGTAPGTATSAPTAAQVATAVWQDTTGGDFTVASSIGKSLYTSGATPGAAGGHFIAGTNAATTITTGLTTTFTGNLTGSVGSVTGAVGSVTGAVGSVTGAVGSVTAGVTVTTNNDKTGYALSATGLNSVLCTEPAAVPTWSSTSVLGFICWQAAFTVNKITQTSTTKTLRNSADNANLSTCAVSDNGTTFTLNKCSP